jgi:hypothetical protein
MSVPGATGNFGGDELFNQVNGETADQRRKRLLAQQQQRLLPGASPAVASLGIGNTGYGVMQ